MQAWIATDDRDRQYLVRTGTGVVTAVAPVGVDPDAQEHLQQVEIYCDAPHGRPGAITYSATARVISGSALHRTASQAWEQVWPVVWTMEWHRHDWIPADIPIMSLNLATDATSALVSLDRVEVPEPLDIDGLDVIPWQSQA